MTKKPELLCAMPHELTNCPGYTEHSGPSSLSMGATPSRLRRFAKSHVYTSKYQQQKAE